MKPRNIQKGRKWSWTVPFRVFCCTSLAAVWLGGCRSTKSRDAETRKPTVTTNAPAQVAPLIAWADVVFVNEAQGYVLLRSKGLLSATGEAKVWRGTNAVARVRLGGPTRQMWLTADILSGHPQPQDRVEITVRKSQKVESGGRP